MRVFLIYPTTLFYGLKPKLREYDVIYIIEDPVYFIKHKYHKLKLMLHRASMRHYYDYLCTSIKNVVYINFVEASNGWYKSLGRTTTGLFLFDPVDHGLMAKLERYAPKKVTVLDSPQFLTPKDVLNSYYERNVLPNKLDNVSKRPSYSHDHFYKWQRQRLGVLMKKGKPMGGKWTYDKANRKKFPAQSMPIYDYAGRLADAKSDEYVREARRYVNKYFEANYGSDELFIFDYTPDMAKASFDDFLKRRFKHFGPYQDAVEPDIDVGFHSMVSHALNIGILTPSYVLEKCLLAKVPIESMEGYIRQLIGWREYVRMIYVYQGQKMRQMNYWGAHNKLGDYWWAKNDYIYGYLGEPKSGRGSKKNQGSNERPTSARALGQEGIYEDQDHVILPLDVILNKVYNMAYAHHIERLMYIGAIMFMLGIEPDEAYDWFMSCCSIDAYDWVMVPNIYGMSQNADATNSRDMMMKKPYFASANYVSKMSSYAKGAKWAQNWNAVYYLFIHNNAEKIKKSGYSGRFMLSSFKKHESANIRAHKKAFEAIKSRLIASAN